jgi:hypothetical protein
MGSIHLESVEYDGDSWGQLRWGLYISSPSSGMATLGGARRPLCAVPCSDGHFGVPSASAVSRAVPTVLLADPGTRINSGIVVSVAPLMGAEPYVDANHPRWLHVHVRPPVRGLLKVIKVGR